jgi:hypothetical protein
MPLQLFFADLHSEVPLQEFTPVHFTVAASAANDAVLMAEVNSMAAAAAIAALDILLICIVESSIVLLNAAELLLIQKTRPTHPLLPNYLS